MPTQNFECIPPTLLTLFGHRQRSLAVNSVATQKCAPNTRPSHCQERLLPTTNTKPQRPRRLLLLLRNRTCPTQDLNPIKAQAPNHSTLRPTRFIHSATMQTTSSGLAQRTASLHNRYALIPFVSLYPNYCHPQNRVNSSIGRLRSSTSELTRSSLSSISQSTSEWNDTIASISAS